mmetsp:Transcript_39230/g.73162  ORF Transcript_39230/g.73162 Transcript_39230/m.73162 type:complete len:169 (-) Transcript_39230:80-586(-)
MDNILPTQQPVFIANDDVEDQCPEWMPNFIPLETVDKVAGSQSPHEIKRPASIRVHLRQLNEKRLQNFLKVHGFPGADEPRRVESGCFPFHIRKQSRQPYPLHEAARSGQHDIVRMLLRARADTTRTNSLGETALEVARKQDRHGSHKLVMEHLDTLVVNAREFLAHE